MTTYKITLTPLDKFFFGGEVTFGNGANESDPRYRRQSYLVRSTSLPQQTTLLGMLREQLLHQNDRLLSRNPTASERTAAAELVGKTGFQVRGLPQPIPFGIIEKISPLQLTSARGNWTIAPYDDVKGKKDKETREIKTVVFTYDETVQRPLLKNFDPKAYPTTRYTPPEQEGEEQKRVTLDELFAQPAQVGIRVTNRRKWRKQMADDEGFFRQTFRANYQSHFANTAMVEDEKISPVQREISFVFYATLNSTAYKLQDAVVQMGGERSSFNMQVEPVTETDDVPKYPTIAYKNAQLDAPRVERLVLTADTYLPADQLSQLTLLTVAETVSFRFFTTTLDKVENFAEFSGKGDQRHRTQSRRYTLLRRGGVLYVKTDQLAALQQAIKAQHDFRQIGYNYYQLISHQ